jgi:2'-5' RNA ligase
MRLFSLAQRRSITLTSTSQHMAEDTKTESGKAYPRSDYAYTPGGPSTWCLRLTSIPGGDADPAIVGAAIAALGKGFRGQQVDIPADDLPAVKAKVRAAWKKVNPDKDPADMPDAVKAAEPTANDVHVDTPLGSTPKKRGPKQTFLNRLYSALREKFSGGNVLSQDDFTAAVKSARGHAGGKTRAENARMAGELPLPNGMSTGEFSALLCQLLREQTGGELTIVDLYEDTLIYTVGFDWNAKYQVPYSIALDGTISFGAPVRVLAQTTYRPMRDEDARTATEDPPTCVIVALVPPPDVAAKLALPGGDPPEQLHLTLFHLGEADELGPFVVAEALLAVRDVAARLAPITGTISGLGRFTAVAVDSGQDVLYASLDSPALEDLCECVEDALEAAGIEVDDEDDHGFTPHITLAHVAPGTPYPDMPEPLTIRFDALHVWIGPQHIPIFLTGADTPEEAQDAGIALPQMPPPTWSEPSVHASELADLAADGPSHLYRFFLKLAFTEAPVWINCLPKPGVYAHREYGDITVTSARNQRFVKNFKNKVYQDPIPVDLEHKTKMSGAAGWYADLRMNEDGSVDARIDWTVRGRSAIEGNLFKFFSPEWCDRWEDPLTREVYEDVLIGGALTTRPYYKNKSLRPLVAQEQRTAFDNGSTQVMSRSWAFVEPDDTDTNPAQGVTPMAEPNTPTTQASEQDTARAQQFAEMQATLAALQSENAGLKTASEQTVTALKQAAERIQAMETDARRKRFTTLATGDKQSPRWFGEVVKHVSLLETLADTFGGEDSEEFKGYVQAQRAMAEQIAQSALFREVGTDASGRPPSAWSKIEQQAKALREQDRALTHEQAISRVIASEPQLYNEYRAEQAA